MVQLPNSPDMAPNNIFLISKNDEDNEMFRDHRGHKSKIAEWTKGFTKNKKFTNALWSGKNFGICVLYLECNKIEFEEQIIK